MIDDLNASTVVSLLSKSVVGKVIWDRNTRSCFSLTWILNILKKPFKDWITGYSKRAFKIINIQFFFVCSSLSFLPIDWVTLSVRQVENLIDFVFRLLLLHRLTCLCNLVKGVVQYCCKLRLSGHFTWPRSVNMWSNRDRYWEYTKLISWINSFAAT